ncbi:MULTISPECIES: hypothetical protein [Chryseobacterium]|uniref:C1q domain-containing protein n=1 Tax=Chryseobacterium camelliae TaxID=1265445 RepID=A0ABU0TIM7_9FLAO|nr:MULTISPECIES: hypothetical protein [Chryseobacterium]MDT3409230.1 hypothetical protein [Pseudacidovorax intermedius]MDQ1096908.1 hypothetical protein [Chryseobacterium camelliae]MDQ1100850.1 hypothetical protein [Chryseobacterium sp. SORGH_AS_1048]MDR6084292.1 hypothetical protein [Chryseobacterium sp. SORGH_AS_0909]MDR6132563.1 hypothetical protein [Chryseobacterium sp. SORGH_AS_1175]
MKKIYTIITLLLVAKILGQVGIGTSSPISSSALDITSLSKGVLIPRVALTSTDTKAPLSGTVPEGVLVFNTATSGTSSTAVFPGLYVWANNQWNLPAELNSTKAKAVKFNNLPSSTTNFNPGTTTQTVTIDIFGTQVFNDDPSIFEKVTDNSLLIKQTGLYLISVNLALKQNPAVDQSRVADYLYFNVNSNLASAKIITLVPQYNPSRVNINGRFAFGSNSYAYISSGDTLTFLSQRYKNGTNYNGTVNFDNTSLSSITIIKIQ